MKPDRCPQCGKPYTEIVRSVSTVTWVHQRQGGSIFGCTVSTVRKAKEER